MFAMTKTLSLAVASAVILSSLALTPATFARTNTLAHSLSSTSTTSASAPVKKHAKSHKIAAKHGKHAVKGSKHAVKAGKHAVKHSGKSVHAGHQHKAVKSGKHAAVKGSKKHAVKHHGKSAKSHKVSSSAPVTHAAGNPIALDPMAPAR